MSCDGYVAEVFRSIQGEGPGVGKPQLFLRLAGCSIGCPWCDTRDAWHRKESYLDLQGLKRPNPVQAEVLASSLSEVCCRSLPEIAITGGEPLEQVDFLLSLMPLLRKAGFSLLLETAGIHAKALERLLPLVDRVSMDWKAALPFGVTFKGEHLKCLELLARWNGTHWVKLLCTEQTPLIDVREAVRGIDAKSQEVEIIVQPLTNPDGSLPSKDFLAQVAEELWELRRVHNSIRLLPQLHPFMGLP